MMYTFNTRDEEVVTLEVSVFYIIYGNTIQYCHGPCFEKCFITQR